MRFGVDESVAIRRSAAEVSRHVLRECRHRGADPYLDSSALPLAHSAEHRHYEIVRPRAGIDRTTDLRHPQTHSVVREHRERERELRPLERASGFPDHHGIEAIIPGGDIG
ncbi:hypothetical protein DAVIS_04165 [Mycobacterium marinum]|uniref:Uncharacterized protein n=1 Tax=Mycobacterium marinum TaxID=1781 RepID=A0A3E2MRK1_MYCMR|nr:hypothetical protein DAVIS_04165 [Mycobacterium marinum]GJO45790.1 hypothetical protein NJB1604_25220 [Mycobacterium marinum]